MIDLAVGTYDLFGVVGRFGATGTERGTAERHDGRGGGAGGGGGADVDVDLVIERSRCDERQVAKRREKRILIKNTLFENLCPRVQTCVVRWNAQETPENVRFGADV